MSREAIPISFPKNSSYRKSAPQKVVYVTDRSTMFSILSHTDAYNLGTDA